MSRYSKDGASGGKNILLVGTEGRGKSSTGNTILGRNLFDVSDGSQSTKDAIRKQSRKIDNNTMDVAIVDALTLPDETHLSDKSKEITQNNLKRCCEACKDGFDFVVFVLRHDSQITELEYTMTEIFRKGFDEWRERHVLIFTHGETFQMKVKVTFADWCEKAKGRLRMLIDNCNNTPLLFHNQSSCNDEAINKFTDVMKSISAKKWLNLQNVPDPLFGTSTVDQTREKTQEDDHPKWDRGAVESFYTTNPSLLDESGNRKRILADHMSNDQLRNHVRNITTQLDEFLTSDGSNDNLLQEAYILDKEIQARERSLKKLHEITESIISIIENVKGTKTARLTTKRTEMRSRLLKERDRMKQFAVEYC